MGVQARIPPGLAALHNFILKHDDSDIEHFTDAWDPAPGYSAAHDEDHFHIQGELSQGVVGREEKARAEQRRNEIAQAMWVDYQERLHNRDINGLE